jgi:hypothetical protein
LEDPVKQAWADVEGRTLAGFTKEEWTLLWQFLTRIIKNMEKGV